MSGDEPIDRALKAFVATALAVLLVLLGYLWMKALLHYPAATVLVTAVVVFVSKIFYRAVSRW